MIPKRDINLIFLFMSETYLWFATTQVHEKIDREPAGSEKERREQIQKWFAEF
jgi:hypothetical protein